MILYAIKDVKIGFWKPFCQLNEAVAVREFTNMVNSERDEFVKDNYSDLELWCLGTYNDKTGEIVSKVDFICSGSNVHKEC